MKVEFLDDLTDGGKYPHADPQQLIRLYDFDSIEALRFRNALQSKIVDQQIEFNLMAEPFIERVNCNLTFRISKTDNGISTINNHNFYCDLTLDSYEHMIYLVEPFCEQKDNRGYQWLYDLDNLIDLLLSPGGSW